MNFPAALSLVGIDPLLTDEQSREVRDALLREEQMVASLDAEIAEAYAALEKLKNQQNKTQILLHLISTPSESELLAIRSAVHQRETRLVRLDEEIRQTKLALDAVVAQQAKGIGAGTAPVSDGSLMCPDDDGVAPQSMSSSLIDIDEKIQRHKLNLNLLINEREEVQADLDAQRALLSPIRRLPLELLSVIFVHCFPDQEYIRPRTMDAPLLLTQVCRGWRDLALSMPSLWSSISVRTDETRCYPRKKLVEAWIQRSSSNPLDFQIIEKISFDAIEELGVESFTTGADLLELFIPAFDRWRSVSLDYSDWRSSDTGFEKILPRGVPPLLKRLSLDREYWGMPDYAPLHALFSSPKLLSIVWDGILFGYPNPAQIMPLHQLHELSLGNILPSEQFFSVLAQAPNLVVCNLLVSLGQPDQSELSKTPLTFSHLKSLRLVTDVLDERIFEAIITPSLEEFKVVRPVVGWNGHTPERFWSHTHFKIFSQNSKFPLKTLDLTDTDVTPKELLELLQCFSDTLENLVLANDHVQQKCVDDDVLRALTPPLIISDTNTKWLCPNLDFIKLWDCISSTDGLVADLFEARWNYGDRKVNSHCVYAQLRMALVFLGNEGKNLNDIRRLEVQSRRRRGLTLLRPRKSTKEIKG